MRHDLKESKVFNELLGQDELRVLMGLIDLMGRTDHNELNEILEYKVSKAFKVFNELLEQNEIRERLDLRVFKAFKVFNELNDYHEQ